VERSGMAPGESTRDLYHFSEDPTIERFVPRAPLAHPEQEPLVWSIDAWHAPLYYLPQDCPRVGFWPLPATTPADRDLSFGAVSGKMVIAIESAWLDRLRTVQLYRYVMPHDSFKSLQEYGAHVSRQTVVPRRVEPVGDLLEALMAAGVELRLCPSLVPLALAVRQTTLHWSLIRLRNAQGWEAATSV
jgi:hypothetical protein